MTSTFSGQILFKELFTERFSSASRLPCASRWSLYALADGVSNAGRLLELLPVPAPRPAPSRCLEPRPPSRSLCCGREPKSLRSEGSPASAAASSAAAADGFQAVSCPLAQKLASDLGTGPALLRNATRELRSPVTAALPNLEASSSAGALMGLPAVISASEDEEGVQVSSSTSRALPCLASARAVLLEEATLDSASAAG
mmetsp:Transcript_111465/g.270804  ORF Transcript_111465/g.270804 Transcript_111465/m.270804 type:complete len:200 (-) Transcript_111465:508-1107(-)